MPSVESLVAPALAGDPSAVRALVAAFTPVIAARAARTLARGRQEDARRRDPQQELEAIAEHVLLVLFGDEGMTLRAWEESDAVRAREGEEGVPVLDYVALVTEQEVGREPPPGPPLAPDSEPGSRDLFDHLHARLAEEHHPRAMEMYRLLVIEDVAVADVCERTGLSTEAVEAWRSRLLNRARQLLVELRTLFLTDSAHQRAARTRSGR